MGCMTKHCGVHDKKIGNGVQWLKKGVQFEETNQEVLKPLL